MEVKLKEHVQFLKDLIIKEDSFEFLQMAHLKTSVIYWSLTAAVLLDALGEIYPKDKQEAVIEYLGNCYKEDGGFAGNEGPHDSHLLFTLSAVQIMIILMGRGNYPSWFNIDKTVEYVVRLQDTKTGAFKGDSFGEIDTRFTYCAVAALSLLNRLNHNHEHEHKDSHIAYDDIHNVSHSHNHNYNHFSSHQKSLAVSFITSCRNFDGGFGAIPGSESHGGNIFCCISSLKILSVDVTDDENLLDWLEWRQLPSGGFNGRPEKLPDVCYSWWILSSLETLGATDRINKLKLEEFILKCQDLNGGIADRPDDVGDVFHTLFGLTGLSLLEHPQITVKIDPLYCLPCKFL